MKIPDYNKKIKHLTYLEMLEEIQRLKEEYVMLQNASDEVEEEKDREIERLNNIIKEFEDWLNAKYEEMHDIWYVKILNKLQELKGVDKE